MGHSLEYFRVPLRSQDLRDVHILRYSRKLGNIPKKVLNRHLQISKVALSLASIPGRTLSVKRESNDDEESWYLRKTGRIKFADGRELSPCPVSTIPLFLYRKL